MNKKPVPGYEGAYEVGDDGNVYSVGRHVAGGPGNVGTKYIRPRVLKKRTSPRHNRPASNLPVKVSIYRDGVGKHIKVKHLVANVFMGRKDQRVGCIDGDETNCAVSNLVLK